MCTDRVFVPIPPSDRDDQVRSQVLIGGTPTHLRKVTKNIPVPGRSRSAGGPAGPFGQPGAQSQAPYTCTCSFLSCVRFQSWRASSTQKFTQPWLCPT